MSRRIREIESPKPISRKHPRRFVVIPNHDPTPKENDNLMHWEDNILQKLCEKEDIEGIMIFFEKNKKMLSLFPKQFLLTMIEKDNDNFFRYIIDNNFYFSKNFILSILLKAFKLRRFNIFNILGRDVEDFCSIIEYAFSDQSFDLIDFAFNNFDFKKNRSAFSTGLENACHFDKHEILNLFNLKIEEKNITLSKKFYRRHFMASVCCDSYDTMLKLFPLTGVNFYCDIITPLYKAAVKRNMKCFDFIFDHCADDIGTEFHVRTFHDILYRLKFQKIINDDITFEILKKLILKTDVNSYCKKTNPIYCAIASNQYNITKLLLSREDLLTNANIDNCSFFDGPKLVKFENFINLIKPDDYISKDLIENALYLADDKTKKIVKKRLPHKRPVTIHFFTDEGCYDGLN